MIGGDQVNLGIPAAARLAYGLRAVFLKRRFHPDVPSPKSSPMRALPSEFAPSDPSEASRTLASGLHFWPNGSCVCRWYASGQNVWGVRATYSHAQRHTTGR